MPITTLEEAAAEINRLQKVAHDQLEELANQDGTIEKLSALLNQIAVILRGPNPPSGLHSFHDLPERVQELIDKVPLREAYIKELERQLWGDNINQEQLGRSYRDPNKSS